MADKLKEAAWEMLETAKLLLADAEDRGETIVPEELVGVDYDEADTLDEDGKHYYPDWLALKRAIRNLRSAFMEEKSCT